MKNFMGKNGFQWFVGVVEDRNDPLVLGRLRVRALGYHTPDITLLPTVDLPWSHVMNPITSATVSGIGQSPIGLVEGSWVIGFFTDGEEAQLPCIIGSLPGVPVNLPGVTDNDEVYGRSRDASGRTGFEDPLGNFPKYKETDVNRLAVNAKTTETTSTGGSSRDSATTTTAEVETNPHISLVLRREDVDLKVSIADIDEVETVAGILGQFDQRPGATSDSEAQIKADLGGEWNEPITTYNAQYPKNHVYETEGGHIREYDDTIGYQRIHERHASGTSYEIDNDGTKITRVKRDQYHIISNDDYIHIQRAAKSTIDKGLKVFVNKNAEVGNNYNIEVGAGANVTVQVNQGDINMVAVDGDINMKMSDDCNIEVGGNFNVTVAGDASETVAGKKDELVTGNNTKTGERIDLN